MNKIFLSSLLFSLNIVVLSGTAATTEAPLIIDEIRKTIAEDFNILLNEKNTPPDLIQEKPDKIPTKGLADKKFEKILEENKRKIRERNDKSVSSDWMDQKKKAQDQWISNKKSEISSWERDRLEQMEKWKRDRIRFIKDIPLYKKNLVNEAEFKVESSTKGKMTFENHQNMSTKTSYSQSSLQYKVIENAFGSEVKDQGGRPTCAAFAAVRAIEILLARKHSPISLSEQYFYWSSKPECQKEPCTKKGSWVLKGFDYSVSSPKPNIPLAASCPYSKSTVNANETQIPLEENCFNGKAKVSSYYTVTTGGEIINAINSNLPVIAPTRLTESFYLNSGYIFSNQKVNTVKKDSHAEGHAILIVGYMKLPDELKQEGTYCYIIANSWGPGWGKGGHSCVSERWLDNNKLDAPFVVLKDIVAI